ncbi:hypothetical protein DPMN_110852 [Dreissena polymorpha]|uniref:Uncharacterized protein n=1 Tax=Dreissena polymorpha TaxID=45954 RepID=A0A9D4KDQ9_DREPO|nr:hypothetical protein DPMN_110852 [Dreissena polymorpha]
MRVYVLQVALLRVPPLALVQQQELMPALVRARFPPHSFYAIWPFVRRGRINCRPHPPSLSLSVSLRLAPPVFARYDLYPTL